MHGHNHVDRRAAIPFVAVHPAAVLKRADSPTTTTTSTQSAKSCGPNDTTGVCERSVSSSSTTLPIVLGAVIPLTVAIIVLIFLHRRHIKKLRNEDANDKHKSLDFGLDDVPPSGKKGAKHRKGGMKMTSSEAEKSICRNDRGLSLDITMTSPYLLPPTLHGSRESLHSLSRSHTNDDKYHTATAFSPTDNGSVRSFRNNFNHGTDDSSSFTGASSRRGHGDDMNVNLLKNVQRISRASPPPPLSQLETGPPKGDHLHLVRTTTNQSQVESPKSTPVSGRSAVPSPPRASNPSNSLPPHDHKSASDLRESNDYLGARIQRGSTPKNPHRSQSPPTHVVPQHTGNSLNTDSSCTPPSPSMAIPVADNNLLPSNSQSQAQAAPRISLPSYDDDDDRSDYGDEQRKSTFVLPQLNVEPAAESSTPQPADRKYRLSTMYGLPDDQGYQFDTRRLTIGIRPLPPEDPSDNPEQRASRIRSFYKEYFDDTKPAPNGEYYEDYGPEDYREDRVYDPALNPYASDPYDGSYHGEFYPPGPPPFAQLIGRRAMTPPPNFHPHPYPPRQHGASSAFGFGPTHRSFSSVSGGDPGPRAFSSISNRPPVMRRKPAAPPAPLHELPTPHKLKDNSMVLPIDFAPAPNSKERRQGRSETPLGGLRPFVRVIPAHMPLASSYDDLAAMPSPHALRKSGTYTALDFAPPARFRNAGDTASDSGSIRSNRTGGLSPTVSYNIRTGAYRLSRLPAETVGTKEDIRSGLRPTWEMKGRC
ncbi:hypothetical protein PABG_07211 [Paracoccidioides brasiliensis Pb03]|nr:hypothetical protein PABG_07211 [Paracoccidioides brasiliensis Pb03]